MTAQINYPLMLRDKLMTKIQAMSFFTGHNYHFHTNRSVQIQPENVPFCGVYLIEPLSLPDGDPNVGEVRFRMSARYGISVIVQNNNAVAAEAKLGEAWQAIETLYADPTFYNWEKCGQPNEVAVQSFNRDSSSYVHGSIGADNSLPIAELRYEMTCDLGTITYPPDVPDTLNAIHITTQFPSGGTEAEIAAVPQVEAHYWIWCMESSNLQVMQPALGRPILEINP